MSKCNDIMKSIIGITITLFNDGLLVGIALEDFVFIQNTDSNKDVIVLIL